MNSLLSFFRRKILRIPADRWNHQYQQGQWDGLSGETPRLDAVVTVIRRLYQKPAILEIGCGKAVMFQRLSEEDYGRFTGVDLSEVAILEAQVFATPQVHFLTADMQSFEPDKRYDVIAFTESLYYAKDPAAVLARYMKFLNPGGCIIVTAFENKYTAKLWPTLENKWKPSHREQVRSGELAWNIRVYQR